MALRDFFRSRQAPAAAPARVEPTLLRHAARPGGHFGMMPSSRFVRSYMGAATDRLLADMPTISRSGNAELRPALRILRARARHLEQNNDYVRKFFKLLVSNVPGPDGFGFENMARQTNGALDEAANDAIELAFEEFSKKGNFTVCGKYSRAEVEQLWIRQIARDGDVIVRHVRGWQGNRFGYAIQLIEADHLDEDLYVRFGAGVGGNYNLPADHEIRMGVERDRWGRTQAYHLLTDHPGDDVFVIRGQRYQRIAAREIELGFLPERIGSARGVPWLYSGMRRFAMLGGYEEAELVAARVSASKMGFYKSENGEAEQVEGDAETADGQLVSEVEPGLLEKLPPGVEFQTFDPQHPGAAFKDFVKSMLRGATAGLGANYNSVANDAEGVNYSSLRHFKLEDQDEWRTLQNFEIANLSVPVFSAWLDMALLNLQLGALPVAKFAKFNAPDFQGRGWQWVDPLKEVSAAEKELDRNLTSHSRICAQRGVRFERVLQERKRDRELATKYGVDLDAPKAAGLDPATVQLTQGD